MVFVVPLVSGLGCYVDKESAAYCSELTLNEALTEAEYTGKVLDDVYLYSDSCTILDECQLVVCKDTCTLNVRGMCDYGIATKDSCKTGCCQTEETCTELSTEFDCIIQAQTEGTELYSYSQGECDCNTAKDYEIVQKDEIDYVATGDPLINYIVNSSISEESNVSNNTITKLNSIEGDPVTFPYVPVALGALLLFLYLALKGSQQPKGVYNSKAVTMKVNPKKYRAPQPKKRRSYVRPSQPLAKPLKPTIARAGHRPPKPQIKTRDQLNAIERIRRTEELRAILRRKRN